MADLPAPMSARPHGLDLGRVAVLHQRLEMHTARLLCLAVAGTALVLAPAKLRAQQFAAPAQSWP